MVNFRKTITYVTLATMLSATTLSFSACGKNGGEKVPTNNVDASPTSTADTTTIVPQEIISFVSEGLDGLLTTDFMFRQRWAPNENIDCNLEVGNKLEDGENSRKIVIECEEETGSIERQIAISLQENNGQFIGTSRYYYEDDENESDFRIQDAASIDSQGNIILDTKNRTIRGEINDIDLTQDDLANIDLAPLEELLGYSNAAFGDVFKRELFSRVIYASNVYYNQESATWHGEIPDNFSPVRDYLLGILGTEEGISFSSVRLNGNRAEKLLFRYDGNEDRIYVNQDIFSDYETASSHMSAYGGSEPYSRSNFFTSYQDGDRHYSFYASLVESGFGFETFDESLEEQVCTEYVEDGTTYSSCDYESISDWSSSTYVGRTIARDVIPSFNKALRDILPVFTNNNNFDENN